MTTDISNNNSNKKKKKQKQIIILDKNVLHCFYNYYNRSKTNSSEAIMSRQTKCRTLVPLFQSAKRILCDRNNKRSGNILF